jgi:hypothetical protein
MGKDYSKGKIYTLRSYQTDEIYIGSTINTLPKRIGKHKDDYKSWKIGKYHYITSFELIKYDDCYIELLELFPCNSIDELKQREGHHQRSMECVNKRIENRTKKEWYNDNANKLKEKEKQYRIENADKIKEYQKEYRTENADKIKEKSIEYYIDNKDEILEKKKEYYINNKEELSQKITCDCGSSIRKDSLLKHQKTKKHQEYLATN